VDDVNKHFPLPVKQDNNHNNKVLSVGEIKSILDKDTQIPIPGIVNNENDD
jgi:hypothetical protein